MLDRTTGLPYTDRAAVHVEPLRAPAQGAAAAASNPPPAPAKAHRRPGRWRGWSRQLGWFGAGTLAAFLALLLYRALFPGPAPLSASDIGRSVSEALASETPTPPDSERVYAVIAPSLVLVQTAAASAGTGGELGSGVVIDDTGDILTSLHVVASAGSIQLTFADGATSAAQITSRQPSEDIAVLRAVDPPAQLNPATLGNPQSVQVGSQAFAVGNPFGLSGSITAGIVSGLDRSFQEPNGGPTLHQLIQFDAAVNPGSSGGPLLNREGEVIGIVTGLVNPTKQDVFVGIGLAVPIDVAGGAAGLPRD